MNQLLEKAIEIALKAHKGQTDKAGQAYILHPLRLMTEATTMEQKIVAVLHDVVEDSDNKFQDLEKADFPTPILEAIDCLTKRKGENYDNFIRRILPNTLAREVKKLDIKNNLNVLRLNEVKEEDCKRLNKYLKALNRLNNAI